MIHLASALGRPIGSLNSWASASAGLLPKLGHNGDTLACVATARQIESLRLALTVLTRQMESLTGVRRAAR